MNAAAFARLDRLAKDLAKLPTVAAQKIAERAAPELSALVLETFNASQDAYGRPWSPGVDGQRITLRESGRLAAGVHYVANGTKLRMVLAASHAKYQLGRRPVAPRQGGTLPPKYTAALKRIADEVCREQLGV